MKRRHFNVCLLLPVLGSFLAACSSPEPPPAASAAQAQDPVTPEVLLAAARAGGDFLLRVQRDDGTFPEAYEVEGGEASGSTEENHLLQAGLCRSLARLAAATAQPQYEEGADRCLDVLLAGRAAPRPEHRDRGFAMVTDGADPTAGDLGATALTLLALVEKGPERRSMEDLESLRSLAAFLVFQQSRVGAPTYRYPLGEPAEASERHHLEGTYAPTQAALALVRLSRLDEEKAVRWRQGAERFLGWVMAVRDLGRTYDRLPEDPWMLAALTELYEATGGGRTYYLHGRRTAAGILRDLAFETETPGSFLGARRVEALAAMIRLAKAAGEDPSPYRKACEATARYLLRCQITETERSAAGMPSLVLGGIRNEPRGGRIASAGMVHALGAWLDLRSRLLEEREASSAR
ncbi:MAG: hypothetical protein KDD47_04110 [Acidobacteria bacterium]|nr:hypothetical protein [Acidobacteriota bacterium]